MDIAIVMVAIVVALYPNLFFKIKVRSGQIREPILVTTLPKNRM